MKDGNMSKNQIKAESAPDIGQHTPGPWHVDTSNGEYAMATNMGEHVFLIGDERRLIPMPEDARLIASAPVLLAERDTLKELLAATQKAAIQVAEERAALLKALKAVVACPDYRHIDTHEMDNARAAIAQAGGVL